MFKKQKNNITPTLRQQIWDIYIGIGIKSDLCPLCGLKIIYSAQKNSGFEAAHIVADKWFTKDISLNCLYLYPSCASCNNECQDHTVLDFLFIRNRMTQLRRMIEQIFVTFVNMYETVLEPQHRVAPMILQHLYGTKRFPAGGGIANEKAIYDIARQVHYDLLVKRSVELLKQMQENNKEMQLVLEYEIKPMRLF